MSGANPDSEFATTETEELQGIIIEVREIQEMLAARVSEINILAMMGACQDQLVVRTVLDRPARPSSSLGSREKKVLQFLLFIGSTYN